MQNAQEIYQQSVVPLPDSEKLRLATIILQDLSDSDRPSRSALELLQTLSNEKIFASPAEVDEHLKTERESWDN